jgi:peptidoglycan biosynthesis protein MviN/MurJ (putative lipid II flippase)
MSRWFYAQKDTRTPLYVSVFTITLNIVLAVWLGSKYNYGLQGLALAQSVAAAAEVFVLGVVMVARDHKLFDAYFWSGVFRTVSVTGFSLVAGYITVGFIPLGVNDRGFITLGTKVAILAGVTLAVHLLVSGLFGLEEAQPFWKWVRRVLYRPVKVEY